MSGNSATWAVQEVAEVRARGCRGVPWWQRITVPKDRSETPENYK